MALPKNAHYIAHWTSPTDIGLRVDNQIFWNDGHIDMVSEHTFKVHRLGDIDYMLEGHPEILKLDARRKVVDLGSQSADSRHLIQTRFGNYMLLEHFAGFSSGAVVCGWRRIRLKGAPPDIVEAAKRSLYIYREAVDHNRFYEFAKDSTGEFRFEAVELDGEE